MEIIVGILILFLVVLLLGSIGVAAIWIFRKFVSDSQNANGERTQTIVDFPKHFWPALALVLLGFHVGLYTFTTFFGPTFQTPALGLLVFSIPLTAACVLLQTKRSPFVISLTLLNLLIGCSFYFRANGFIQSWSGFLFVITQLLLLVALVQSRIPASVGEWFTSFFSFIPLTIKQFIRLFQSIFRTDVVAKTTLFSWLKTALFAFVVLLIFLGLLSQADPVFAEIVRTFREQLFGRVFWSLVIILLATAWWSLSVKSQPEKETIAGWLSYRDVTAVLTIIVVVVAIFLGVQFQYLFAGSTDLLERLNLTFSEYVRQGFSELLLAVLIGGVIAYLAGIRTRLWSGKERLAVQLLNSAVILELSLLLFSAFRRNVLYVATYGLTRVRVVGDVFLIWLTFFLVLLLAFAWQRIKEKRALGLLWVGALLVLLAINILNVDKMVVAGAPSHHQYTDYFYLMQLSEDAGTSWPVLMDQIEADTDQLLTKTTLSDEEKAQLAGAKLAVISFVEKRDALYLKYAPEDWLKEHQKQIGVRLDKPENIQDPGFWWYRVPVIDSLYPSEAWLKQNESRPAGDVPETLKKFRSWSFWNYAESQTYQLLASQEKKTFDQPKAVLEKIIRYQLKNQISLYTEENRLLHELKYQFITVNLDRFWPQQSTHLFANTMDDVPQIITHELVALAKSNEQSIEHLAARTCEASNQATVTLYGALTQRSALPNGQKVDAKVFGMTEFFATPGSASIMVLVPQNVSPIQAEGSPTLDSYTTNDPYAKPILPSSTEIGWQPYLSKVTVTTTPLQTADKPCEVIYIASQVQFLGWMH